MQMPKKTIMIKTKNESVTTRTRFSYNQVFGLLSGVGVTLFAMEYEISSGSSLYPGKLEL